MEQTSKSKKVRTVPEGFRSVNSFLVVENAAGLIEFIKKAFDGQQTFRMDHDEGKIMHATIKIGDSTIMLCDVMENAPPQPAMLYLYVEDADVMYKKAIAAKATSIHEPTNEFYGDRAGAVKDAWGNTWWIATHVEDVDEKELQRRSEIVLKERKEQGHTVHP